MKAVTSFVFLSLALSCASHALADMFGSGLNTFDIEFVRIGNPGNPDDNTGSPNPAGKVDYSYRMGKYEISEQMIDKANTLGGLGITASSLGADKPATSVSWNEAARFVNWLNTSSNSTPAYKFALQPGDVGYSATADIELWDSGDAGYNPNNLYRNSKAKYFLPSVDEWYKAAYYDPNHGGPGVGDYWNYPTDSNIAPTAVASGTASGTAVFGGRGPGPADITLAGGLSSYGTMGQGGNVYEWEESSFDLLNNSSSSNRGRRGGGYTTGTSSVELRATSRTSSNPAFENGIIGFRVASIPEPSTLLLFCFGALGVAALRRWRGNLLSAE